MMLRLALAAFAALALANPAVGGPPQQAESVNVGPVPSTLAVDAASGKVIVGNAGAGRGAPGSVAILERDGRLTSVATPVGPYHVAFSPALRIAVATHAWENQVTLVHIDTLATVTVPTAKNPAKAVIDERAGLAYVVGKDMAMSTAGGVLTATSTSFVTVIDLRTHAAQVYSLPGFAAEDLAASPDGKRLYLMGSHDLRTGEEKRGFVQAFDVVRRTAIGSPTRVGRIPRALLVSRAGDKVYIAGHMDYFRGYLPADDMRRNSIRPALFVLDAATLATERTIPLPDTKNLDLRGGSFVGVAGVDPATGLVHVLDRYNARLTAVDPLTGAQRTTAFEAPALSFAFNPVAGTTIVSMNTIGQAAILSSSGTRLDTVPIGRAPGANQPLAGEYGIAVDGATGDAYLANGHDQSITILRRAAEPTALVNLTDVWYDPQDPGWGVFIDHQGIVLFATLFTHDSAGDPTWFVMSNGVRQPDGSFSGVLYRTRGPATTAVGDITPAGIMRVTPDTSGTARMLYVVDGSAHTRVLQRFHFDAGARECGWSVGLAKSSAASSNFTSLWSDPREQGWGVAVSHQGRTAFGVLFSYDAQNRPSWAVMSNGRQQASGAFSGELFRAKRGRIESVGTMTLDFAGSDAGTVAYRVEGVDYRSPIARQAMTPLVTRCSA